MNDMHRERLHIVALVMVVGCGTESAIQADANDSADATMETVDADLSSASQHGEVQLISRPDVPPGFSNTVITAYLLEQPLMLFDLGSRCYLRIFSSLSERSAGRIETRIGDAAPLYLDYDNGYSHVELLDSPAPGTVIEYQADGDVVPAFSGAVVMPPPIEGTVPTRDSEVSRSSDYVSTWVPADVGSSFVVLGFSSTNRAVSCYADDENGTVVIPSEVLQELPDGYAIFVLSRTNRVLTDSADPPIYARASSSVSGSITLVP